LIAINAARAPRCFLDSAHIEEARMPVESIIVVAGIIAAFGFFAIVLGKASRETDRLLRERTRSD
jgi:hypothetical protein